MVRGLEEEDLQCLSEEAEREFWENVTTEDLEYPDPRPILVKSGAEMILCLFSDKDRAWEVARHFHILNIRHPAITDPITLDDLQVMGSGDVGVLLTLCDKAETEQAATGGIIDPPPDFFESSSAHLVSTMSDIMERIRRKAEESAW
jgi:hypothetical protein